MPQLNFPPNFNCEVILLRGDSWRVPGSKIVGKRESERQAKSWPCGEKFPPVLFSCSRFLDSADLTQSQILEQATILDKIKWNSKPPPPPPPKSRLKPRERQNGGGGGGGLGFPFILSEIVGRRLVACELDADSLLAGKLLIKLNLAYILLFLDSRTSSLVSFKLLQSNLSTKARTK